MVEPSLLPEQHSLTRSIILHLAPGAIFTAFIILAAPALASAGVDPIFALGGIGLVLVPIELGYLALQARRMTGSWSPLNAVNYKEWGAGPAGPTGGGLLVWFFLVLVVSIMFWIHGSPRTCSPGCPRPCSNSPSRRRARNRSPVGPSLRF